MGTPVEPTRTSTTKATCARLLPALLVIAVTTTTATDASGQEPTRIPLRPPDWVADVEFTRIVSVRELSDGVLVANAGETRLVFVGWQPGSAVDIGRTGGGPTEYRGVGQLYALPGDSTVFVDSFSDTATATTS